MSDILILVASENNNLKLAESFRDEFEKLEKKPNLINLVDLELPLYSTRAEKDHNPEKVLMNVLPEIEKAKGIVFIAPEYNGSVPPVFTNFLAWLSRSSKNWRKHLNGKVAAIATFSGGGGTHVLVHMRLQLSFIGMNVLGREILTHFKKPLNEESLTDICQEFVAKI